ncbi:hypothetical protein [Bacillus sp. UNCCL13]|uniref:hypothetical protein n=1 Tax=Bacillus sp. UNCCL13 TaxID=1502772 RepID=UPI001C31A0A2|nr:hypothetical protein [Bacillus sp. UNCCL13]
MIEADGAWLFESKRLERKSTGKINRASREIDGDFSNLLIFQNSYLNFVNKFLKTLITMKK